MGDESPEISSARPSPDSLCSACQTINGEVLLKTRTFQWSTESVHYNAAGELQEERSTPSIPGIYHTLFLENPAASVETCAACKLFHNVARTGITLSEPAVLRLCLKKERDQVEVEDVAKVERERERAEKTGETPEMVGTGRVSVFADYGKLIWSIFQDNIIVLISYLKGLSPLTNFHDGRLVNRGQTSRLRVFKDGSMNAIRSIRRAGWDWLEM
jgi:hypothetical protein